MKKTATREQYEMAFAAERERVYQIVDEYELKTGFALNRERLLGAARVLACPVKVNPPCWQHGRVVYSSLRQRLSALSDPGWILALDVGTAKGFSALCAMWAVQDTRHSGCVVSCDVIDPVARVERNTVADVDTVKNLFEILQPWPEARDISFVRSTGANWLHSYSGRIHYCFLDGKHSESAVRQELALLRTRQQTGDVVVMDDVHMAGVGAAMQANADAYEFKVMVMGSAKTIAVGRRR